MPTLVVALWKERQEQRQNYVVGPIQRFATAVRAEGHGQKQTIFFETSRTEFRQKMRSHI